jgi:hypothetical protein
MAPGDFVTISKENGRLCGEVRGRNKTELLPESPDHFFRLEGPTVQFIRSSTGSVTELVFDGNFHAKKVS